MGPQKAKEKKWGTLLTQLSKWEEAMGSKESQLSQQRYISNSQYYSSQKRNLLLRDRE